MGKIFQYQFYHLYSVEGTQLLFNIIIFLKASKRLPEFSGLKGKVYPGQLKPRYQVPQPRIDFNQNGLMEKDNNVYLMPPEIIIVKPV